MSGGKVVRGGRVVALNCGVLVFCNVTQQRYKRHDVSE